MKMIISIIILMISFLISPINIYADNSDQYIYTVDEARECREKLGIQFTTGKNPISIKTKMTIDKLLPKLEKQYSKDKLFSVNNKIISMISKSDKNSIKFNTYGYLMLKIDYILDDYYLKNIEYIKKQCSLLLTPLIIEQKAFDKKHISSIFQNISDVQNNNIEDNNTISDENIYEYNYVPTETNNTKDENINKIGDIDLEKYDFFNNYGLESNKYKNIPNLMYELSTKEIIERVKPVIIKNNNGNQWAINKDISVYTKLFDVAKKVDKETYKNYINSNIKYYDNVVPFVIADELKDKAYDIDLSSNDDKIKKELKGIIANKINESGNIAKQLRFASGVDFNSLYEKSKRLKIELDELQMKYITLVRKKWELKNICYELTLSGYNIKNRSTFQTIGIKNSEYEDLIYEAETAMYYGYNMHCYNYFLYPELTYTIDELRKLSLEDIEKLYNNHGFLPTSENTHFYSEGNIIKHYLDEYTKLEIGMKIHEKILKIKEKHFMPIINEKKGIKLNDIFKNIKIEYDLTPIYNNGSMINI